MLVLQSKERQLLPHFPFPRAVVQEKRQAALTSVRAMGEGCWLPSLMARAASSFHAQILEPAKESGVAPASEQEEGKA